MLRKVDRDSKLLAKFDNDIFYVDPDPPVYPSSRRHVIHEIRQRASGEVFCTCPEWRYNPGGKRNCVHMRKWVRHIVRIGKRLGE